MNEARPLPEFLITRHRQWQAALDDAGRSLLAELAQRGQTPRAMIIACCDSRVMAADVFGAQAGEFFVHRNIANLVPPCNPDSAQRATSATIEYAVTVLKVEHLIVMGHSGCGGVAGCYDLGTGGSGVDPHSFVAHWLEILSPRVAAIATAAPSREEALRLLEQEAVVLSLENLMTFPFVREEVEKGRLQIHGLLKDIGAGELEFYDPALPGFRPV